MLIDESSVSRSRNVRNAIMGGDGQRDSISAVVDDTNLTGIDSLRAKKMIAIGKPIQQVVKLK